MDCDKGLYYDHGTNSCAYCSQLCSYVDIQGTRAECEGNCPGFLQSTTQSVVTATTSVLQDNPWYIVAIVLSCLVAFVSLGAIIYMYIIPAAVRRLKKQDCCGDGESRQPHTQETGSPGVRTEAMGTAILLPRHIEDVTPFIIQLDISHKDADRNEIVFNSH